MTKIISQMKKLITEERGAIAITVAIVMFVLLGFAAFAIDFGYVYVVKNELQNAADAAALAGASVLFEDDERCVSPGLPFACCTGDKTGECVAGNIDAYTVEETAKELAALNKSGGSIPDVQIGHYAFADTWGGDGSVFTHVPSAVKQIDGWQTSSFKALNENTNFINAVHVTLTRNNIPRFFSRIWSKSDNLGVSVQSTAYLGFTGSLLPGEADQPIAICEDSIKDGTGYKCNVGTMLNDNTQTSRWSDLTQPDACNGAASDSDVKPLVCADGNPESITFGKNLMTSNGTQSNSVTKMFNCWSNQPCTPDVCLNPAKYDSDDDGTPDAFLDTNSDGKPDQPWKMTLPVIDCDPTGNCLKVVGAVVVNVVWINDKKDDDPFKDQNIPNIDDAPGVPSSMYNPITETTWTCSKTLATDCWNEFQAAFQLQNNNLTGPAKWEQKSIYFIPDCDVHVPAGTIGGQNYGIQAVHPVLVKESKEKLPTLN